jgi:asparagine synthase (glutamine-hydrolysing)
MKVRPDAPLHGFTSVPEAGWKDKESKRRLSNEQPYVEALAAMYPQLVPEFVDARGLSFDHNLKNMFLMGSVAPRNAMNLHWIHQVYARAKTIGCDVVLTGAIGNATFSFGGEGATTALFARGKWIRAVRETWAGRRDRSFPRALYSSAVSPFLPLPLWAAITRIVHGKEPDPFDTWCPMTREWAQEMRVAERAKDMGYDQHYRPHRSTTDWRAAVLGNAGMEGPDVMQGFSALHGIAERDPTAYRPLVEFCMGIPDDQFVKNGQTRRLARRMLTGKVPDMVLKENRRGLQAADWAVRLFRQKQEMLEEIDGLAGDPVMAKRLDLPSLRKAVEDLTAETPDDDELAQRWHLAVTRGLTTARFIRFADGRNDG